MSDFVDLTGVSGASYRFRRLAAGESPQRIAGHYAVLKSRAKGFTVRCLGATDDLSQARAQCPPELLKGAHLYIRLNVPRGSREAEQADLTAAYGAGGERA